MTSGRQAGRCTAVMVTVQLVIITQLFYALFVSRGQFVRTEDVTISPFQWCLRGRAEELVCGDVEAGETLRTLLIVSLYAPLVLMLFATMAYLFTVCNTDRGLLLFSVGSQALGSAMMLFGILIFIMVSWRHVTFGGLSGSYYLCVCACAEMAGAAVLSRMSGVWPTKGTGSRGTQV